MMEQISSSFELTNTDIKRWGINVLKYVVLPGLFSILVSLKSGTSIDWTLIITTALGAIVDIIHRYVNNNANTDLFYSDTDGENDNI
ncbi:MAG TPA: hypothetical protein PLP73_03825 [Candidatus Absconditabacterales bacterium]|nr:hypothetical protein [Candidatus Absconditabacterales bacterium]